MPYYPEKNILFIHIPKTGGSVIECELKRQYTQHLYSGLRDGVTEYPYNNVSLQHQYFVDLYNGKDILGIRFSKDLKVFAVVRNPYDRVISDLFWYGLISKESTSDYVSNIIRCHYLHRNDKFIDGHNRPQYKYVVDEKGNLVEPIKIFKCEQLNDSNEEINNYLGVNIDIKRNDVNKDYSRYINQESIELINDFYKRDFEMFGYQMK